VRRIRFLLLGPILRNRNRGRYTKGSRRCRVISWGKPRVFVLTDIGNEPDDQMSLTRFLLYSNEFDIEGLVATTSTWQRDKVSPEIIQKVLSNYGRVRENLLKHADGFPTLENLSALVKSGQPAYGMSAVGSGKLTPGAQALIEAADRKDTRPLYVSVWEELIR
jgi:hypothetical protein